MILVAPVAPALDVPDQIVSGFFVHTRAMAHIIGKLIYKQALGRTFIDAVHCANWPEVLPACFLRL